MWNICILIMGLLSPNVFPFVLDMWRMVKQLFKATLIHIKNHVRGTSQSIGAYIKTSCAGHAANG